MDLIGAKSCVIEILEPAGIEDSAFEAEQLIMHICDLSLATLRIDGFRKITEAQEKKLLALSKKRAEHYPLQYLLGEWEFYSLPFKVNEDVLIPRADTELLVGLALDYIGESENLQIIDLCSGSGCVAIAIDKNTKNCNVTAAEKYTKTLDLLKENIKLNRSSVKAIECDVLKEAFGSYDLIVSNPPYIKSDVVPTLDKEVLHEPQAALDGGKDGLEFYKAILRNWLPTLRPGGAIMVEIGYDQGNEVMELFKASKLTNIECKCDFNGNQRVIIGTLPF